MSAKKTILVTGASSGFGKLISETLARNGHTVVATMRDVSARNAEAADAPGKMWSGVAQMLEGDGAPDPQAVADAVADLVSQNNGNRPARTVVDPLMGGAGAPQLNALQEQVQQQLAENMEG